MYQLNPREFLIQLGTGRVRAVYRLLTLAGLLWVTGSASVASNPDNQAKRARLDLGFVASGEVRKREEGSFRIAPWAHRLPARVDVKISDTTRFLRQRKGELEAISVGDLVLVVEQPPNAKERQSRKAWEAALKKKRITLPPEREARVRALLRCWKAEHPQVETEDRQAARALLNGALPFFRGPGHGSVKPPDEDTAISVGVVQSLDPLTLRNANGVVKYTADPDVLVIDHDLLPEDAVKNGQTVLVHSPGEVAADQTITAAIVAISPRPRLAPERERRLIIRERKKTVAGAGDSNTQDTRN